MDTSTTPPEEQPPAAEAGGTADTGPRVTAAEARDLGRLLRSAKGSPQGRYVAGVAGGLGRHFDVDPAILRVAFVVLTFFGGAGLLLYLACWLFVPDETDGKATVSLDERTRTLALYVAAGLAVLALLGDTVGRFEFPWPLAIIALILLLVFGNRDRRREVARGAQTAWSTVTGPSGTVPPAGPGAAAGAPAAPYGPPPGTYAPPTYYVPTPNPRKRGPILFWFTLALIALLEGVLGIVDAATGASVPDPAYAAVAVGVSGLMLVLGAFWGRAGGLILVGLVSTLALVASVGADEWDWEGDRVAVRPTTAADVLSHYEFETGEFRVDLRDVADLSALDGHHLTITGSVGKIEVIVPDGVTVDVRGEVSGPGNVEIFDSERGGISTELNGSRVASDGAPMITIDADLDVGSVQVVDADSAGSWRERIQERSNR
ncbi:MAG TPA: PspC domain-containing protein [Nocardioides sp.]|uniref:PspC domain-containing protein n=1 Tax=Nocardioides sp. TaxID=35761 RepID=UPI002ED913DC